MSPQNSSWLCGKAIFLLALILTFPLSASSSSASLTQERVYGADNVIGFVRENENFIINVTATIPGDPVIEPTQVSRDNPNTGPFFDKCESLGNSYFACSTSLNAQQLANNPFTLTIRLFNEDKTKESETTVEGTKDILPPQISSFRIVPNKTKAGNVSLQFSVQDVSFSPLVANRCSGIKKIEFSSPERGLFKTVGLNGQPNLCQAAGSVSVPVDLLSSSDGVKSVTLTAFDSFSQQSSGDAALEIDSTPPTIIQSSFQIKDVSQNDVNFIGAIPRTVSLSFAVASDDVNPNGVFADISSISKNPPSSFGKQQAVCSPSGSDSFLCAIANVQMDINESKTVQIIVNASDALGNKGSTTLAKPITFDNRGPVIASLKSSFFDEANDTSYAGRITSFFLEFVEVGVGVNPQDVALDLSQVSSGLSSVAPDRCRNDGTAFTCTWANKTIDGADGLKQVKVLSSTKDKLGNQVTGVFAANVTVDKAPPAVISSQFIPTASGTDPIFPGFLKTGDSIALTVAVRERNDPTAAIDFSSIVTSMPDPDIANCARVDAEAFACTWNTRPIDVPGHIVAALPLVIQDKAGNTLQGQQPINILEYNASPVALWAPEVTCSPDLVDRQLAPLINIKVYCRVRLNPTSRADQETLFMALGDDCTETVENSLDFIDGKPTLSNAQAGSREPFIEVKLVKDAMRLDRLDFSCPIHILSRFGDKITNESQKMQVPIAIGLYNNPLGAFDTTIKEKVQDSLDAANNVFFDVIGILKEIVRYAGIVCNVLQTIQKLRIFWNVLGDKLTTAHLASLGTPGLEPKLGIAAGKGCEGDALYDEFAEKSYVAFNKWCKILNCQESPKSPDSHATEQPGPTKEGTWWSDTKDFFGSWRYNGNKVWSETPGLGGEVPGEIMDISTLWTGRIQPKKSPEGRWNEDLYKGKTWGTIADFSGQQPYQYMNARDNLGVALLFGCIPGIINGLENIRQLYCMKADCLANNALNNVPPAACDDLFWNGVCKYAIGELFSLWPPTAFLFKYWGTILDTLQNPITAIFSVSNVLARPCVVGCGTTPGHSLQWKAKRYPCALVTTAAYIGELVRDVTGIIESFDDDKVDYCERVEDLDEKLFAET
ncbi:hypothetical protein HYV84_06270 [Candidatus Woesearchaeota archaeon]|nr:hypothetical protein [Candidatus Woesearchaeota archaeon]